MTRHSSPLTVPAAPRATVDAFHGAELRETTRSLEGTGGASSAVVMTLSDICSSRSALSSRRHRVRLGNRGRRTTRMLDEQSARGRLAWEKACRLRAPCSARPIDGESVCPSRFSNQFSIITTAALAHPRSLVPDAIPSLDPAPFECQADRENRMTTREHERAAALRAFSRSSVHDDSSDPTAHLASSR